MSGLMGGWGWSVGMGISFVVIIKLGCFNGMEGHHAAIIQSLRGYFCV